MLDDIAGLAWNAREAGLVLDHDRDTKDLEESFLLGGHRSLPILVSAMLFFDSARYSYNHEAVRRGLDALDGALPSRVKKQDFAILAAVEHFATVGATCDEARDAGLATEDSMAATNNTCTLPSQGQLSRLRREALDGRQQKALDWILHTTMLLPLPESPTGGRIEGIRDYLESMQQLADSMLESEHTDAHRASVIHFRRSRASYGLGDVDGAIQDIENAIRLLDKRQHAIFDQYYSQLRLFEQERSTTERLKRALDTSMSGIKEEFNSEQHRLEREVQNSARQEREFMRKQVADALFRVVEILGVFLALIGLLGSTIGTAIFASGDIGERIGLLLIGFGGTLLFFVLLRIIVGRRGLRFWASDD